jgi:hypothetical protein
MNGVSGLLSRFVSELTIRAEHPANSKDVSS